MSKLAAEVLYNRDDKVTISVYCHRHLVTPWTSEFTANQRMDVVVERIWTKELCQILLQGSVDRQELNLYHIPGGVAYAPDETFIERLGQYFKDMGLSSLRPIKSSVTRLMTLVPSPAHNRSTHIYFVLSVPDSSGTPVLPGLEPDEELDDGSDGEEGEEEAQKILESSYFTSAKNRASKYAQDILAPSQAARLKTYARRQNRDSAFYDGRYHYNKEKDTRAPPVAVLHPSFALFLERLNDPSVVLDEELVQGTYQFMVRSTAIYLKEADRVDALSDFFSRILRREVEFKRVKQANPDGSLSFEVVVQPGDRHVFIPVAIFEYKVEPGAGGCDAGVQALSAIENFWLSPHKRELKKISCCPTFGVAMDGPWLRIYACVQADKWICQPLLPAIYTAIPSKLPSKHILSVCKVFQAFRDAIDDIDHRTKELVANESGCIVTSTPLAPQFGNAVVQPSVHRGPANMTPAPTVCGNLTLEYVGVIDRHNLSYIAQLSSGWQELGMSWPRVVVKFAEWYGADAHRLLEKAGYAPKLIYCGSPYATAFPQFSDLDMVVIEALPNVLGSVERAGIVEPPSAEACRKVRDAVRLLHRHHYVHGNITWQTVYFNHTGNGVDVRLLNFDYAGKEGKVRYPVYLPQTPEHVELPGDVAPLKLVTKEQDEYFLDAMFPGSI